MLRLRNNSSGATLPIGNSGWPTLEPATAFLAVLGTKDRCSTHGYRACVGLLLHSFSVALVICEVLPLLRAFLTIVVVAALSACLVHLRDAQGQRSQAADVQQTAWVRTVDGWEPSRILKLQPRSQGTPALHPALVATLQLGISLFGLLALPTTNRALRKS